MLWLLLFHLSGLAACNHFEVLSREHPQEMARSGFAQAVLALSTLSSFTIAQDSSPSADGLATSAYATSTGSVGTATVSGATSTYSIPFTGEQILPFEEHPVLELH